MYSDEIERVLGKRVKLQKICVCDRQVPIEKADAAIAVGGDGTVLHAARSVVEQDIPLLGINAGSLGFLSCISQKEFIKKIDSFLDGNFICNQRLLLSVCVKRNNEIIWGPIPALNDCIIRSTEIRAFVLKAVYDKKYLTEYFGDGLIISTPSGSTAYSLASSGPIITPELDLFLLNPICPHTLTHRPVIVSSEKMLSVEVSSNRNVGQKFVLSLDGQENFTLSCEDVIEVKSCREKLKLLSPKNFYYFDTLRKKLSWGER